MENKFAIEYFVSHDGEMFYRRDSKGHWYRHGGDARDEHSVEANNPGLHKVRAGAADPISKSDYEKGIDPHPIQ